MRYRIDRLGIPAYNWWNECLHGVGRAGIATVFPQAIGLGATWNEALLHDIAVAISDDGSPVDSAAVMKRALDYAKMFNIAVVSHAEDMSLSAGAHMNEGYTSTRLGIKGNPTISEEICVARDVRRRFVNEESLVFVNCRHERRTAAVPAAKSVTGLTLRRGTCVRRAGEREW